VIQSYFPLFQSLSVWKRRVSKINKLVLVICISERQIERRWSGTSSAG
jgi:hypothetical protein